MVRGTGRCPRRDPARPRRGGCGIPGAPCDGIPWCEVPGGSWRICCSCAWAAICCATSAVWMPWNRPSSHPTSWAWAIRSSASEGDSSEKGRVIRSSSSTSSGARPSSSSAIERWWISARRARPFSSSGALRTSSSSCLTIEPIRITLAGCSTRSAGFVGRSRASSAGGSSCSATPIPSGVTTTTRSPSLVTVTGTPWRSESSWSGSGRCCSLMAPSCPTTPGPVGGWVLGWLPRRPAEHPLGGDAWPGGCRGTARPRRQGVASGEPAASPPLSRCASQTGRIDTGPWPSSPQRPGRHHRPPAAPPHDFAKSGALRRVRAVLGPDSVRTS